jgi:hypothetical protein
MSNSRKTIPDEDRDSSSSLDFTAQELINEILEQERADSKRPGEFTTEDYMDVCAAQGLPVYPKDKSRKKLCALVDQGLLTKRTVNHTAYFSRRAEPVTVQLAEK